MRECREKETERVWENDQWVMDGLYEKAMKWNAQSSSYISFVWFGLWGVRLGTNDYFTFLIAENVSSGNSEQLGTPERGFSININGFSTPCQYIPVSWNKVEFGEGIRVARHLQLSNAFSLLHPTLAKQGHWGIISLWFIYFWRNLEASNPKLQ